MKNKHYTKVLIIPLIHLTIVDNKLIPIEITIEDQNNYTIVNKLSSKMIDDRRCVCSLYIYIYIYIYDLFII